MTRRICFIISVCLVLAVILAVSFYSLILMPLDMLSEEETVFVVKPGEGLRDIALNLERENLIRSANFFQGYALWQRVAGNLKAGNYVLSPSMNVPQIVDKLFRGEVVKETITIIEGWNLRQIASYFESRDLFKEEEFRLALEKDFSDEFDFLKDKPADSSLEGYLFPDTYEIRQEESIEQIIKKMLANFDRKLDDDLRQEISRQNKSVFEIVIMASLLEKEVRTFEDKKIAADIFWKKIKAEEPLYSCATIAYILQRQDWSFEEMRKEIALARHIDSFYNTYRYAGLPPGPIANPGLESIKAAVYPAETDYNYFLSLPNGETVFSRTLEEHNARKAEYFN